MPPARLPTAKRCSPLCTMRATKGVQPPGDRLCPTCGATIPRTRHGNHATAQLRVVSALATADLRPNDGDVNNRPGCFAPRATWW